MQPKPIIAICTHNEADNIGGMLERLRDYTVILVDNSSTDGTALIAKGYENVIVFIEKDLTIGSAYKMALARALRTARITGAEKVVQMYAGAAHDPAAIEEMLKIDADLVIGSRFCDGTKTFGWRALLNKIGAYFMTIHVNVKDCTSGFRVWKTGALRIAVSSIRARGFAFQLETLKAVKDMTIKEFPIEYKLTNSSLRFWMILEAIRVWRLG